MNWNNDEYESVHEQKMFLSIYFLREYIVTYISQKNSQQKTKKNVRAAEEAKASKALSN